MIISTFAAEMLMMFQIVPIMWRAVRPSRIADMPAVVNTFWLRKGYEGLTFFGQILTPTQQEADRFNAGASADRMSAAMKNHEMIHLGVVRQTFSTEAVEACGLSAESL